VICRASRWQTARRCRPASQSRCYQDVDRAELLLGGTEQQRGCGRIGQVRLNRHRTPTCCLYLRDDWPSVMGAGIPVGLRSAGIGRALDPQERAQHPAATLRQSYRDGGADAMIGPRHNRRMISHRYLHLAQPRHET
jgi:hypothetical protein